MLSAFIGLAIGWLTFYIVIRWLARRRLLWGMGEALPIEEEAEEFLKSKGFQIIDRQRKATLINYINSRPNIVNILADFIVKKDKQTFIAQVDRSSQGLEALEAAVRRQLVEIDYVFKPDGILLVDVLQKNIRLIEFELPENIKEKFAAIVISLIFVSIIVGLLWLFVQVKLF